jgi:hypothetical protein
VLAGKSHNIDRSSACLNSTDCYTRSCPAAITMLAFTTILYGSTNSIVCQTLGHSLQIRLSLLWHIMCLLSPPLACSLHILSLLVYTAAHFPRCSDATEASNQTGVGLDRCQLAVLCR